jgi:hypothetical protein
MRTEKSPLVTVSRKPNLLCFVIVLGLVLSSTRSYAQWWKPHIPVDYEECAEGAERSASSKENREQLTSECEAKFAGRRKPGGGYTYYDFMQNRHFDIAGPNPTPAELKQIDEQYTVFLDRQRQSMMAAELMQKQTEQAEAFVDKGKPPALMVPIPVPRPRIRAENVDCHDDSLSCGWSRFTGEIQRFKKTLLGPPNKASHG